MHYRPLGHTNLLQNPYSLLNRLYENGLSEFSHREGGSLLAYSPLAFGALTGQTSLEQLQENISALDVQLSEEVLAEIQAVHQRIANPAP